MFKTAILAATIAVAAMTGIQSAHAAGASGYARGLMNTPTISYIVAKRPTLAPFAHVRFCAQNPKECTRRGGASVVALSSHKRNQLTRVNASVNGSIRGINDSNSAAGDIWQVGSKSGDCEDFALTKRQRLIGMGWSPRALRIAVARTGSGEGHAVLVVKTDQGDLVLDNRTNRIKNWRSTGLTWVKIQSGDNPRLWYNM